jgi:ribonucleoside-triphosphate reductase
VGMVLSFKQRSLMKKCDTEVYSRITGYYQQNRGWNKGKKAEFKDRKTYNWGEYENKSGNDSEERGGRPS